MDLCINPQSVYLNPTTRSPIHPTSDSRSSVIFGPFSYMPRHRSKPYDAYPSLASPTPYPPKNTDMHSIMIVWLLLTQIKDALAITCLGDKVLGTCQLNTLPCNGWYTTGNCTGSQVIPVLFPRQLLPHHPFRTDPLPTSSF